MKIRLFIVALTLAFGTQAQLENKALVVPEFSNGLVKLYIPTSATTITADANYTIDLASLPNGLATAGSPNCTALLGNDLFITITAANQRIYRFPNYLTDPATAIAGVSQVTNIGNDYVGLAFDANGNLYTSEGDYLNTRIVKYTSADNYATRIDLGNGLITSYFANIAFDAAGNLWATDYYNNRVIAIASSDLSTPDANFHVLSSNSTNWNANNGHVENTIGSLQINAVASAFSQPEGIAFDSNGRLWIANNNDSHTNEAATLVRISTSLQNQILNSLNPLDADPNLTNSINGYQVWNVPSSASGTSQLGGLQIDQTIERLYVNEQVSGSGLWFDLATLSATSDDFAAHQLNIVSTNPGNGGISLAPYTSTASLNEKETFITCAPNPAKEVFTLQSSIDITTVTATDATGRKVNLLNELPGTYRFESPATGLFMLTITLASGEILTKRIIRN